MLRLYETVLRDSLTLNLVHVMDALRPSSPSLNVSIRLFPDVVIRGLRHLFQVAALLK